MEIVISTIIYQRYRTSNPCYYYIHYLRCILVISGWYYYSTHWDPCPVNPKHFLRPVLYISNSLLLFIVHPNKQPTGLKQQRSNSQRISLLQYTLQVIWHCYTWFLHGSSYKSNYNTSNHKSCIDILLYSWLLRRFSYQ